MTRPSPLQNAPPPHRRVRLALCAILLLVGVFCGLQAWTARESERLRASDAEAINLAGAQRMLSQRIGRMAALLADKPGDDPAHHLQREALRQALGRSLEEAARLETLLIPHGQLAGDASAGLLRAIERWQAAREGLWYRAETLLRQTQDLADAPVRRTLQQLQADADTLLPAAEQLVSALQQQSQVRSERSVNRIYLWGGLTLGLLFLLAAAVAEPTVRALKRQHRILVRQAAELQRLALVAERTTSAVLLTGTEGRIHWVNEAFTRISGLSLSEVRGRPPDDVLRRHGAPEAATQPLAQALARGEGLRTELLSQAKDGKDLWLDIDLQPLRDSHGSLTGFVLVQSDITERMQQREQLKAMLAALPTGLVVWDTNGQVLDGNHAAENILGLPRAQLLGHHATDACWRLQAEDSAAAGRDSPVLRTLHSGLPLRNELVAWQRPDGSRRWLLVNTEPLSTGHGRSIRVLLCFVDVTEQRNQQQRLRVTVDGAGLGTWEWDLRTGMVRCNAQWWHMLGYETARLECPNDLWLEMLHPDDQPAVDLHLQAHLRDAAQPYRTKFRMKRADGSWSWVMASGAVVERDSQGEPLRMTGIHVDIDRERSARLDAAASRDAAQRALAELDAYRAALDQHAIVAITTPSGVITWANDVFCRISQYRRDELVGQTHSLINSGHHPASFWRDMWAQIGRGALWRGEVCNRAKDGSLYWVDTTIVPRTNAQGEVSEYLAIRIDISHRKQLENDLRHAALTDSLTQLPNRTVVLDRLQQAIVRTRRVKGYHYALLFMDFDRFKLVNDSLGHGVGDELLRQIALRLQVTLRSGDSVARHPRPAGVAGSAPPAPSVEHTAARIGGDEFVVLLDGLHHCDDAQDIAQRLLATLSVPYQIGSHTVHSSASIGIVTSDQGGHSADAVLRDADTAMYEAKRTGRGRAVVFHSAMHERVAQSVGIENELRTALAEGQLYVVYQPVINLATGRADSVEALARWQHPQRGHIPPVQFIPVAEDSGLIGPLGEFVLGTACQQFMRWQRELGDAAPRSIAVNLSRAQLQHARVLEVVREVLNQSGMAPHQLHLEITESLAAQDSHVQHILHSLKDMGVQLSLDDFGTGYSSLACLHELPVHCVKIDRSFVSQAETSDHHRVLIQATVLMAQTLGMATVAEGVETPGQAELLRTLNCQMAQGYLFSKPLAADAFETWLVGQRRARGTTPEPQLSEHKAGGVAG